MVARLIPDQKVGCSTHPVLTFFLFSSFMDPVLFFFSFSFRRNQMKKRDSQCPKTKKELRLNHPY